MRSLILAVGLAALANPVSGQRVQLVVPLETLQAQAARDSNDPVRHYELALGYLIHRRYDEAERSLRVAVEIEPGNAAAYLALAYVPFARNPRLWEIDEITEKTAAETVRILEGSERLRQKAFMLDPMVELRVLGAIIPPSGRVGGGSRDLWNVLLLGFENMWVGNYQESYRLFSTLLNSVPESRRRERIPSVFYWYHGLAAAHVGEYPTAITDVELLLNRALEREQEEEARYFVQDPFRASNDYRYFLATIKLKAGATQEALTLLQQTLEQNLSLYPAHTQLAAIHETRRAWPRAIEERERALATNPDDPALLFDLGGTLARAGNTIMAVDVLTRAMEANPRNSRIPHLLGLTALRLGRNELARVSLERFLALAPSRFNIQVARVRAQLDSIPSTQ
jgi:tetratricopeptide (TPR) repeat protein